jgi:hypothetical protein
LDVARLDDRGFECGNEGENSGEKGACKTKRE